MSGTPSKLVLIGVDAPVMERVRELAQAGELPAIKGLMDRGVWAENCLVPFPTITPPNWTTIATGAWPGTHSITCFQHWKPGSELDDVYFGFDTADCQAEYLWEAAERAGKRSIILNYPSSWPPTVKEGVQVGGYGLSINQWHYGEKTWSEVREEIGSERLYSNEAFPRAEPLTWEETTLDGKRAREAHDHLVNEPITIRMVETPGAGFERVIVRWDSTGATLAELAPGEWSERIVHVFETKDGPREAAFMLKLVELSPDGERFRLYATAQCALDHPCYPESVTAELRDIAGLPMPGACFRSVAAEWVDDVTAMEIQELQHVWYAEAVKALMGAHEWDLFFMHAHCPDWMHHAVMKYLDPMTEPDAKVRTRYTELMTQAYKSTDRMIGRIVEAVPADSLIILVSDHGAVPTTRHGVDAYGVLKDAGLMVTRSDPETGEEKVDWSKTRAVTQRSVHIYVNLKGRDPQGIVEPADYEAVRDEIIRALYDYTDPENGLKPFALVLKREDARMIGLTGPTTGDIVYAVRPEYGHEHGQILPPAKFGVGSMLGMLLLAGPGVKKGEAMARTCWLTDIVPTVCELMDLPLPAQTEGAVLYQALEKPNVKSDRVRELEKQLRRYKKVVDSHTAQTHSY